MCIRDRSFNRMSADLARSTQLRKQMTADIDHDLRTPLSVILGYSCLLYTSYGGKKTKVAFPTRRRPERSAD